VHRAKQLDTTAVGITRLMTHIGAHILGVANCVVWRDDDVRQVRNKEVMADEHFSVFTAGRFRDSQQSTGED